MWRRQIEERSPLAVLEQMRQQMDRIFEGLAWGEPWAGMSRLMPGLEGSWPRANVYDTGTQLAVWAEVPGLAEKELKLTLNQQGLTISGSRKTEVPKGYSVHRQERPELTFSRSFALPCPVNPEQVSAVIKDGMLTVTLTKAPEAQPRQIPVKVQ
ncbi:MAG: Hsp20/alpha crystallin family protein [Deltaproteobacteria bacterium]|nr:Hsp20/alpha crystallin family protein [Deltaproteobacteria bacterium]